MEVLIGFAADIVAINFAEKVVKHGYQHIGRQVRRRPLDDDVDIQRSAKHPPVGPEKFPDATFQAVPCYRVADLAGNGNAQARPVGLSFGVIADEMAVADPLSGPAQPEKLRAFSEPV